jgi:hypothetical protein
MRARVFTFSGRSFEKAADAGRFGCLGDTGVHGPDLVPFRDRSQAFEGY